MIMGERGLGRERGKKERERVKDGEGEKKERTRGREREREKGGAERGREGKDKWKPFWFLFWERKEVRLKTKKRLKEEEIEKSQPETFFFLYILSDLNQAVPNHLAVESQTRLPDAQLDHLHDSLFDSCLRSDSVPLCSSPTKFQKEKATFTASKTSWKPTAKIICRITSRYWCRNAKLSDKHHHHVNVVSRVFAAHILPRNVEIASWRCFLSYSRQKKVCQNILVKGFVGLTKNGWNFDLLSLIAACLLETFPKIFPSWDEIECLQPEHFEALLTSSTPADDLEASNVFTMTIKYTTNIFRAKTRQVQYMAIHCTPKMKELILCTNTWQN